MRELDIRERIREELLFEVYSKWIDKIANQLGGDKMQWRAAQHLPERPIRPSEPESEQLHSGPVRTQAIPKSWIWWRARQESNLYQELRKLSFYPLNYGRSARRRYCTQFSRNCMNGIKSSVNLSENPVGCIGLVSMTPLYNPAFACRRAVHAADLCSTDFLLPPPGAPGTR